MSNAVLRRRVARIAGVLVFVGALAAAPLAWLLDKGHLRLNYPSRARYPVRGIDVSHHQGTIDWRAVARSGDAQFAYLKATEGGDFVDPRFAANRAAARREGVAVGAYHFFTFCRPGDAQAENFVRTVPREPDALPPALDLEFGGNCAARPTGEAMWREVNAFIARVREHYGHAPVLYFTREFADAYGLTGAGPAPALWARDVFRAPRVPGGMAWTLWQYGNRGRVPGITGPVDLNVFAGGREEWARFRRGGR